MTQPWPSVGQPCICIDDAAVLGLPLPIRQGAKYTVREVLLGAVGTVEEGQLSIRLNEIAGKWNRYMKGEVCFLASRFRPLHTASPSEDLAVFRRIADLAGVDEALRRLEGVE